MSESLPQTMFSARTRWLIWSIYFVAWTAGLLHPDPFDTLQSTLHVEKLDINFKFFLAKGLHISAYALLTILTGWLATPIRWRWLLMFILMAHGPLTERLQMEVPGRTGSLRDVLFDMAGISLGLVVSWPLWSRVPADRPRGAVEEAVPVHSVAPPS
jgi:VanZ family protein